MIRNIMHLSVVICTYNNSSGLKQLLDSLLTLEKGEGTDYEILVVDNNSTDATKDVVKDAEQAFYGKLRYCLEEKQGLSYARNRGIKESKGEFLAFIDDDIRVSGKWLSEIVKCIRLHDPDCFAVRVLPEWEKRRPAWLTDNLYMNLGLLDYGSQPFRITSVDNQIVGSSFVVRKGVFADKRFLFKPQLGRKGKALFSGEETELFFNLLKSGSKIWYWPASSVYHRIPADRTTIMYLLKWNFHYGQSAGHLKKFFPEMSSYGKKDAMSRRLKILMNCVKTLHKSYAELLALTARYIGLIKYYITK